MAPRKKKSYSDKDFINALAEIRNGNLSIRKAAAKYGIPTATLGDRVSGRYLAGIQSRGKYSIRLILYLQ